MRAVLPGGAVRQPACAAYPLRSLDRVLVPQATADLCRYVGRRAARDLEGAGFIDLPQTPRHAKTPAAFARWHYTRPLLRGMIRPKWPKSNLAARSKSCDLREETSRSRAAPLPMAQHTCSISIAQIRRLPLSHYRRPAI